ncbi:integrase, catalytic region, zinc finger, CCHC-type containing protein, partial [Tanacetum coccineum]
KIKEQFDSIKKTLVRTKELCDSLIDKLNLKSAENEDLKSQIQDKVFVITSLKNDLRKLKGKEIVDIAAQTPSTHTIVPGTFKLDLEPLTPRLLQNREMHIEYLKYAQEQADILWGIVKQAKAKQPLDKELDFACKHAQRIHELLVYVRDTCPNAINLSAKKVVVTPKNKVKKVRLKCFTSKCGSKPTGNKKNDRISQPPSRNMKNKVEAQPRKVNKKNRVVEPICDVNVKHSLLNANSDLNCATCKKSLFDDVYDKCRTFTIVGNSCPLTRITSANIVPPKKTTSHSVETQKPELKVYSRKPKNVKNVGSSKKAKIVESKNANHSEPNHTWGSNATDIPSSSSLVMTVRFGNDHIARIMGYGDYQLGNVTISRVYYVEGLGHNLFSVGQFCDADLEVAFWKNTCFIRNLEGVDLLSGSRDTNLYTISLDDMLKTSPICLLSKASKTKSWLWHRRLSHLNFGTLNKLAKDGLARGIPRLKFQKDHLSKDEAPDAIIKCIKIIQVCLNAIVRNVRTEHLASTSSCPRLLNDRRCSKAPLFLWAEAINTACYTQNRSLIRLRYNKTPYELMQDKKPDLSFFHVFGALCYPTNDNDDLGKLDAKADIGIFVGYAPAKKAFRIYNKRTRKIIETIHVIFDELTAISSEQFSLGHGLHSMTPATSKAAALRAVVLADSSMSTSIDQDAPSTSITSTQEQEHSPNISQSFEESPKTLIFCDDPLHEFLHEDSTSQGSSSNVRQTHTPFEHLGKWTKDHPIPNAIGDPSRSVFTRKQLQTDAM